MLRHSPGGIAGTQAFVPNDTALSGSDAQIMLLTGPNMAGKSTYIRQVALITLMAHVGCWVPAKRCRLGLVDRIFSRVGASDDLARGNSTFMVEMNETANILNNATDRSLIILDEVGRGTSTYDGLSIAWAVVEHLHRDPAAGPRTLFATHYQELTQLDKFLPRLRNFSIAVKEWNDEIIFVRRVIPGAADRSYGIQVARLAGLPLTVIDRAELPGPISGQRRQAIPCGEDQLATCGFDVCGSQHAGHHLPSSCSMQAMAAVAAACTSLSVPEMNNRPNRPSARTSTMLMSAAFSASLAASET